MTRTIEICIPVWNEEKRIESVLSALRAQTFKDFAVRIYDNGSDDGTVDLARKFQNDFDLDIRTRTRNIGQNSNINRSFANCTSPYVALLSGNDIVAENYLETLFAQLDSNPSAACAHAKQIRVADDGRPAAWQFPTLYSSVTDNDPVDRACKSIAIYWVNCQFFALYRRSALDRARPQPFRFGGDHVLACEIALYGKVLYAEDTFMKVSPSPGNESVSAGVRHLLKMFSIDWQRALPLNSKLGRFEHVTPLIDMFHGHLDMFRLADIPHEMRERLVVQGTRALIRRYEREINADIQRIVPVLRAVRDLPQSGNLLDQVLLFHALRKADECLLLGRSPELIEIRNKLSRLLDAGNKPAEVSGRRAKGGSSP